MKVFDMPIKMSNAVVMCGSGILNLKSKCLFDIWPLTCVKNVHVQ